MGSIDVSEWYGPLSSRSIAMRPTNSSVGFQPIFSRAVEWVGSGLDSYVLYRKIARR